MKKKEMSEQKEESEERGKQKESIEKREICDNASVKPRVKYTGKRTGEKTIYQLGFQD